MHDGGPSIRVAHAMYVTVENLSDVQSVNSAPFDRDFYLILNVAVGGKNGWFPENQGNKPWLDGSSAAMRDFWNAKINGNVLTGHSSVVLTPLQEPTTRPDG